MSPVKWFPQSIKEWPWRLYTIDYDTGLPQKEMLWKLSPSLWHLIIFQTTLVFILKIDLKTACPVIFCPQIFSFWTMTEVKIWICITCFIVPPSSFLQLVWKKGEICLDQLHIFHDNNQDQEQWPWPLLQHPNWWEIQQRSCLTACLTTCSSASPWSHHLKQHHHHNHNFHHHYHDDGHL